MRAGANIDADLVSVCIGIFLASECLDVTLALLVGVIDDPGFLRLALPGEWSSALA